jgi:hypothetical protein
MAKRNTTPRVQPLGDPGQLNTTPTVTVPNVPGMPTTSYGMSTAAQLGQILSGLDRTTKTAAYVANKSQSPSNVTQEKGAAARSGMVDADYWVRQFESGDVDIPGEDREPLTGSGENGLYEIEDSTANQVLLLIEEHGGVEAGIEAFFQREMVDAMGEVDPRISEAYNNAFFKKSYDAAIKWHEGREAIFREGEMNDAIDGIVFPDVEGELKSGSEATYFTTSKKGDEVFDIEHFGKVVRNDDAGRLNNLTDEEIQTMVFSGIDGSLELGKSQIDKSESPTKSFERAHSLLNGLKSQKGKGKVNPQIILEKRNEINAAQQEYVTHEMVRSVGMKMFTRETTGTPAVFENLLANGFDPLDGVHARNIGAALAAWVQDETNKPGYNQGTVVKSLVDFRDATDPKGVSYIPPGSAAYIQMTTAIGVAQAPPPGGSQLAQGKEDEITHASRLSWEFISRPGEMKNAEGGAMTIRQLEEALVEASPILGYSILKTVKAITKESNLPFDLTPDARLFNNISRELREAQSEQSRNDILAKYFAPGEEGNANFRKLGKPNSSELYTLSRQLGETQSERQDPQVAISWNMVQTEFLRAATHDENIHAEYMGTLSDSEAGGVSRRAASIMQKLLTTAAKPGASEALAQHQLDFQMDYEDWVEENWDYKTKGFPAGPVGPSEYAGKSWEQAKRVYMKNAIKEMAAELQISGLSFKFTGEENQ